MKEWMENYGIKINSKDEKIQKILNETNITILRCSKDYGPATKLLGVLEREKEKDLSPEIRHSFEVIKASKKVSEILNSECENEISEDQQYESIFKQYFKYNKKDL